MPRPIPAASTAAPFDPYRTSNTRIGRHVESPDAPPNTFRATTPRQPHDFSGRVPEVHSVGLTHVTKEAPVLAETFCTRFGTNRTR
ncbi:MAG: hypothetical protein O3A01_09165 [bacterium]|nr:hypothetical protein [bacterium]